MKTQWDERYSQSEYIYGTKPNLFFKEILDKLPVGKSLFPAEGEGRNAVYAASKGWQVDAFDQSREGKRKAEQLAKHKNCSLNYQIFGFEDISKHYAPQTFDLITLTYAHLPLEIKAQSFESLTPLLKVGGLLVFEGFSKEQLMFQTPTGSSGGPGNIDMLFSKEELTSIFKDLEVTYIEEIVITLDEGVGHRGDAAVIQFIGRKK